MANTPGGLPYPLGTDFVVNGDNAIRALAEALDGKLGVNSITNLTPAAGWSGTIQLIQKNGWAYLNARVDAAANAADLICTLPAAAFPAYQIVTLAHNGAAAAYTIIIDGSGAFLAYGHGSAAISDLRLATVGAWPMKGGIS